MRVQSLVSRILCGAGLVLALASMAEAQATRTWVSGVGDDANPCSRTAPCKTWAGAISKTATNGFMNALDPGGFGALTITKGITVDGGPFHAGTLASGTNGFIVNAAGAKVTIRNVDIEGINSCGTCHGITILAALSVSVENVHILNMGGNGINHNPIAPGAALFVDNTTIRGIAGNGILAGTGRANINNTRVEGSLLRGIAAQANALVTIRDSIVSGGNEGISTFAASSIINAESCVLTNNQFGVVAGGGGTVRLSNTSVLSNSNTGLFNDGASTITSLSGNTIAGNPTPGVFTGAAVPKQ